MRADLQLRQDRDQPRKSFGVVVAHGSIALSVCCSAMIANGLKGLRGRAESLRKGI